VSPEAPLHADSILGLHFGVELLLWLFVFAYFTIWRFLVCSVLTWREPNFLSMVLGFNALGWVVAILRDARWMSRWTATLLYAGALSVGILSVLIIAINEASRRKPWSREKSW